MKKILASALLLFLLVCDRCLEDYDCLTCSELRHKLIELEWEYGRASTFNAKQAIAREWNDAIDCYERSCQ